MGDMSTLFVTVHRGVSPRRARALLATDDAAVVAAVLRALRKQLPEVVDQSPERSLKQQVEDDR